MNYIIDKKIKVLAEYLRVSGAVREADEIIRLAAGDTIDFWEPKSNGNGYKPYGFRYSEDKNHFEVLHTKSGRGIGKTFASGTRAYGKLMGLRDFWEKYPIINFAPEAAEAPAPLAPEEAPAARMLPEENLGSCPIDQLEEFMIALSGQESGGSSTIENKRTKAHGIYQIMPANWDPWSKAAGLPDGSERTAENQERVARHKLCEYFKRYNNWWEVALSWYGGRSIVMKALSHGDLSSHYNNYRGHEPGRAFYADQVLGRTSSLKGSVPSGHKIWSKSDLRAKKAEEKAKYKASQRAVAEAAMAVADGKA